MGNENPCPKNHLGLSASAGVFGFISWFDPKEYLSNSRIEIFTGEFKKISQGDTPLIALPDTEVEDYFSGDVIITTIDQILNGIISHQKVTSMMDFMQYHVVFDEFHELIVIPAMNLLFAELIEAKNCEVPKPILYLCQQRRMIFLWKMC